jgi:hypothetical protein
LLKAVVDWKVASVLFSLYRETQFTTDTEKLEIKLMSPTEKHRTKKEVIESIWDELGSESVGAKELELIRRALEQSLGRAAVESPAQIARTLADLGVKLRHPEVLNADLEWREAQVEVLFESSDIDFGTIESAILSMERIEMRRVRFLELGGEDGVESLKDYVRELKAELVERETEVTLEVVQWVTIWLQNPEIFSDWLALRQKSPEFIRKFG